MLKVNENRIEEILSQLTLDEKIGMIHGNGLFKTEGVSRMNIPPLKMSDGPMGVRNEFYNAEWKTVGNSDDYVTYLPSNSAIAASWNRRVAYESGQVLGEEFRGRGKDVMLGPGINIKRDPRCGRNFEYMSEDPRLIEELVVPLIKGVQESDVAACVKHFALNNQETERLEVDVKVDDRALREIYLRGFKAAIEKGDSYSLMGAYNRYHGIHCCQNDELLGGIARDEWGYDGMMVSDWGGVHDTELAAKSPLDIEMSVTYNFDDYYMANPLKKAVKEGKIEEKYVDEKVRNILRLMLRLNMLDGADRKKGSYNTAEHREKVLNAARESVILLKNEDNILPLNSKEIKKIAVIGMNAQMIHSNGGGSAEIKALYEISPLMGIAKELGGNTEVVFAKGYHIPKKEENSDKNWQESSLENHEQAVRNEIDREESDRLLAEAVKVATEADKVIVVGGLNHDYDVEGFDKSDIKLPYNQDRLIKEILKVRSDAVIVIVAGSAVEMNEWIADAKSCIYTYYAGMETGTAIADVIFGNISPSGRLPETFPVKLEDTPVERLGEFGTTESVEYGEGIFVGYRYYDTYNVTPQFPFGYGLSYTDFDYDDYCYIKYDNSVKVSCSVTNTGSMAGSEVIQIFSEQTDSVHNRPKRELVDFEKIYLEPGETKTIDFLLDKNLFTYYDTEKKAFATEDIEYNILICNNGRDIINQQKIRF